MARANTNSLAQERQKSANKAPTRTIPNRSRSKGILASSDEVSAMFKDTEMGTQKAMLMTSLVYMSDAHPDLLSSIAERHDKDHLNIKPYFYALWLDSLVAAAKSIDPLFDVNTEKLWRETLQEGIDFMISKYEIPADIVA